ncbi:hypothetical protein MJ956_02750 [Aurantimonas sp. LRZ36]|uniref:Uncharacterized protein n=2 Tax=Aurantimonas marianensis TaxID=2920428 RepID=A0A9X2KD65_9HYPH|nr:hypothetical protein [Aurantimonas marianensis]
MRRSLESAIGYGIGCALVGLAAFVTIAILVVVAMAFPLTLTVVLASLAGLALLRWRQSRAMSRTRR